MERRHKRAPLRTPTLKNDIYISRKSSFAALEKRARKLLKDKTCQDIYMHGMGAAMNKVIELVLDLRKKFPDTFDTKIETSTVDLMDDVVHGDGSFNVETRCNSAIHIHLIKKMGNTTAFLLV